MTYYLSANSYFRKRFGQKVYKLALDGGFTCPNRDGLIDKRGCIFCSGGSGDFAIPCTGDIYSCIENAKALVKAKGANKYIAYFQSFTGTYASVEYLKKLYTEVIIHPDIVALSIGTRPDCLEDDKILLLKELNCIKPVIIELGLQTIHENTAEYIRRGYPLKVFDEAMEKLNSAGIETIVHMIIGLPGEDDNMIVETAKYIGSSGADGIKFQLLHVLKGTDLADDYLAGKFDALDMDHYISLLEKCINVIPHTMVVHRLTGDGAKRDLIAPLWSADKKRVINEISKVLQPL